MYKIFLNTFETVPVLYCFTRNQESLTSELKLEDVKYDGLSLDSRRLFSKNAAGLSVFESSIPKKILLRNPPGNNFKAKELEIYNFFYQSIDNWILLMKKKFGFERVAVVEISDNYGTETSPDVLVNYTSTSCSPNTALAISTIFENVLKCDFKQEVITNDEAYFLQKYGGQNSQSIRVSISKRIVDDISNINKMGDTKAQEIFRYLTPILSASVTT